VCRSSIASWVLGTWSLPKPESSGPENTSEISIGRQDQRQLPGTFVCVRAQLWEKKGAKE
jgi:hypothetical protein